MEYYFESLMTFLDRIWSIIILISIAVFVLSFYIFRFKKLPFSKNKLPNSITHIFLSGGFFILGIAFIFSLGIEGWAKNDFSMFILSIMFAVIFFASGWFKGAASGWWDIELRRENSDVFENEEINDD